MINRMTNRKFAETDEHFKECVEAAQVLYTGKDLKPTTRQASKFRMGKGLAYRYTGKLIKEPSDGE